MIVKKIFPTLSYFSLLFSLFLLLHLFGEITSKQFQYLNELLDMNRLEEVITKGEALKKNNQENIELRTLLFKAYLAYNLPSKAGEEITFIESRIQNSQTIYLRAFHAFYTNNLVAAIDLLDQITEKRYSPPYLLYFQIRMVEGKFSKAESYLEKYRGLEGENENWFFHYGRYLLNRYSPKENKEIVRHHIQKYAQAFPANHRQMYLRADYYATQGQFDRALKYIEKAIYLSSPFPNYLDRKIYYLYRDHQFHSMNQVIDSYQFSNRDTFNHYQWLKSFVNFIRSKKEKSFTLKSSRQLFQVLDPLEKILKQNPENEMIRYFAEEILLANTFPDDKRREPYASYRYNQGINYQGMGRWEDTQYIFKRMLLIAPQEKIYLDAYLEYLRFTQQYEKYQLEAKKYLTLFSQTNQEHRYIPIRKQLADKEVSQSLAGRHGLKELIPSRSLKAILSYTPSNFPDSWNQPYLEVLAAQMVQEALQVPPILNVDLNEQSHSDKLGARLAQGNYDYQIDFSIKDIDKVLTINLIVKDRQKNIIYNQPNSFYGKERYQKMVVKIQKWVYEIFPKIGEVVIVKNRQAVISLGAQHGATSEDKVAIIKNGKYLGSFPLEIVNNYYSLITIDKIFTLSQTEIGDQVVLERQKNND